METATLPTVDQFKDLVRQEWSDPATVAGWRRWFPKMLVQFQAGTDLLLQAARWNRGCMCSIWRAAAATRPSRSPRRSGRPAG